MCKKKGLHTDIFMLQRVLKTSGNYQMGSHKLH